jgi:hypothetical protein
MYKHDIHRAFTYFIFLSITLLILITTVPISFHVTEYTYMIALIFSYVGTYCISGLFLKLHETIKDTSVPAIMVRSIFIALGFIANCLIVLLGNWLFVVLDILDSLNYTWYCFTGGITWLISFQLSKLVPNLPHVLWKKKKEQ